MNLKDAFRFQNKLNSLQDEAIDILADRRNILKTETTYLRKKVMPEADNEVVVEDAPSEYAGDIGGVAEFLMMLLEEREALSRAIRAAKETLPMDLDSEVSLNRRRQELAGTFRRMTALRSSETVIPDGGVGYRFNAEGNQVTYRCAAKHVSTINFNRNQIRALAARLDLHSDDTSSAIDRALVSTQVDYPLPFAMNDSFDEILGDFLERRATA